LIWIWADSTANGRNKYTTEGDVIVHAPTLDRRPRFEVEDTPYGYWYSATRRPVVDSDKNKYVRTMHDQDFRLIHGKRENWGQNPTLMKGNRSWTGLTAINIQDFVVQESMGTMYDRRKEHLGAVEVPV